MVVVGGLPWKEEPASRGAWSCLGNGVNLTAHPVDNGLRFMWEVRLAPLDTPNYDRGHLIDQGKARTAELAKRAAEDCYAALTRHVMRLSALRLPAAG